MVLKTKKAPFQVCPRRTAYLTNESNYIVDYEIFMIEGCFCTSVGVDLPNIGGLNGTFQRGDRDPVQRGVIDPESDTCEVQLRGGPNFHIRWKYRGLHMNWSFEERNFDARRRITFTDPSPGEVERITEMVVYDSELKCDTSSTAGWCKGGGSATCRKCGFSFCKYHYPINNTWSSGGLPKLGGHDCSPLGTI